MPPKPPARSLDEMERVASLSGQSRMGLAAHDTLLLWDQAGARSPSGYHVLGISVWKRHFEWLRRVLDSDLCTDPQERAALSASLAALMRPFAYDQQAWGERGEFVPRDSMHYNPRMGDHEHNMVVALYIFNEDHRREYEAMRVLARERERLRHRQSLFLGVIKARALALFQAERAAHDAAQDAQQEEVHADVK